MQRLSRDLIIEILSGLDFKDTYRARRVCIQWEAIFQTTPYPNAVNAWELADLPQDDIPLARKICNEIGSFATDESEEDEEAWALRDGKILDANGNSRLNDIWILPMLTNLRVVIIGRGCTPSSAPQRVPLCSNSLRAMLDMSRNSLETMVFQVWEEYMNHQNYDMEKLVAGVQFLKMRRLILHIYEFRTDLLRLKQFCSKMQSCFPNLKNIDFVVGKEGDGEILHEAYLVQDQFVEWVKTYKFPGLPDIEVRFF